MAAKKAKKSLSKTVSKSAFVRGLPPSMPAKEVVAKAKAAGLTLSDRYVHVIRSIAKRAQRNGHTALKAPRRGGRPISSKRTFVLSLPASLSAAEVIKRAKAEGMNLTTNYVYKIRSRGAAANEAAMSVASPSARGRGRVVSDIARSVNGSNNHDEHFVALVLDVGLARAAALLERVRARVQEMSL
jgi:DNA-binding transcriptional MocR family regulator